MAVMTIFLEHHKWICQKKGPGGKGEGAKSTNISCLLCAGTASGIGDTVISKTDGAPAFVQKNHHVNIRIKKIVSDGS